MTSVGSARAVDRSLQRLERKKLIEYTPNGWLATHLLHPKERKR